MGQGSFETSEPFGVTVDLAERPAGETEGDGNGNVAPVLNQGRALALTKKLRFIDYSARTVHDVFTLR